MGRWPRAVLQVRGPAGMLRRGCENASHAAVCMATHEVQLPACIATATADMFRCLSLPWLHFVALLLASATLDSTSCWRGSAFVLSLLLSPPPQFEDFNIEHAAPLLERYRYSHVSPWYQLGICLFHGLLVKAHPLVACRRCWLLPACWCSSLRAGVCFMHLAATPTAALHALSPAFTAMRPQQRCAGMMTPHHTYHPRHPSALHALHALSPASAAVRLQ